MRKTCGLGGAWLLASAGVLASAGADDPPPGGPAPARGRELFRQRVRPMLQAKCLGCHGDGEELEGDLDLRNREAMLRGGKGGPALVPGNSHASPIYQTLLRTDERVMPPRDKERPSAEEIAAVKAWIDAGAPWVPD